MANPEAHDEAEAGDIGLDTPGTARLRRLAQCAPWVRAERLDLDNLQSCELLREAVVERWSEPAARRSSSRPAPLEHLDGTCLALSARRRYTPWEGDSPPVGPPDQCPWCRGAAGERVPGCPQLPRFTLG